MSAEHHIDNKSRLIITRWSGDAIGIDFIEAIKTYQRDVQNRPDCIDYNEVVDFSGVTKIDLTTTTLKNIGKVASRTDQNHNKRKLAFVVGSNKAFFFARMYTMFRSLFQNSNKDIRVFNNENEALEWVKNT